MSGTLLGMEQKPEVVGYSTPLPPYWWIWRGAALVKQYRFVLLGVLALVIVAAVYAASRPPSTAFDAADVTLYHDDKEMVYVSPDSTLYHFGNCPAFDSHLSPAMTVKQLRTAYRTNTLTYQPCPKCAFPDKAGGHWMFPYQNAPTLKP